METGTVGEWTSQLRYAYKEEFAFYSRYHQQKVNWVLHALSIPAEWISFLLLLCYVRLEWVVSIMIAVYYVLIDTKLSVTAALAHLVFAWTARELYDSMDSLITVLVTVALVQVSSWFIQVAIGHHLCEGNKPAMMTKLSLNAVVLSVLLAWDQA